ncbi:MAG: hypothetical protein QME90_04035 [Thermodesulfobacteriota bacterium]|nr:hypothetical protein [Thermodesulfobacteriota bacterium]
MVRDQERVISFDKWKESMSKDIFLLDDDKPKSISRLYDMFGDDFDEEDPSASRSKKK